MRSRLPQLCLVVGLVGAMLALGAVHLLPLLALTAVLTVGAGVAVANGARLRAPVVICLALSAYTLMQAVPLPLEILARLAPHNADIWARSLLPTGAPPPTWAPLSLDPGASSVEALKWFTAGAAFLLADAWVHADGAISLFLVVAGSSALAAVATISHGLLGLREVWGFYKPGFAPPQWHIGPLLNSNSLAGYLNLGIFICLGAVFARRTVLPRPILAAAAAFMIATMVMTASRGGIACFLIGVLFFACLIARSRLRRRSGVEGRTIAVVGAVVIGGGGLAALAVTAAGWHELFDPDLTKLKMFRSAWDMAGDFPWFGVGRGAFESVFPAYFSASGNNTYTHPENIALQWTTEWGVPVSVSAAGALAASFRGKVRSILSTASLGAAVGAVVLLLQNFVDLGLEIPAVAIIWFVTLGGLQGARRASRATDSPRGGIRAAILFGIGAALMTLAIVRGGHDVTSDRSELADDIGSSSRSDRQTVTRLRQQVIAAMTRHPADGYFPLCGAYLAVASGTEDPMPWLERTLERSHGAGRAHLLLASVLARRAARSQAMLELRLALEEDPALLAEVAQTAVQLTRSADLLVQTAPSGASGVPLLDALAQLLRADPKQRAFLDQQILAREPDHLAALRRLAEDSIERARALDCDEWCAAAFHQHVQVIAASETKGSNAAELEALWSSIHGNADEGLQVLAHKCEHSDDRLRCLEIRARIAAQSQVPGAIEAATSELLAACTSISTCATAATTAGSLRAQRGDWRGALSLFARAVHDAPTRERLMNLGDAASHVGLHLRARDAFEQAAHLGAPDPALQKRIADEQAAIVAVPP